jgi:hypothetical protein
MHNQLADIPSFQQIKVRHSRLRLHFGMRTLLVLVLLTAVVVWVGEDVWSAARRHQARQWLTQMGGSAIGLEEWNREHLLQQPDSVRITTIQRWLGDETVVQLILPSMATDDEVERARSVFPEAQFISLAEPRVSGGFF